MPLFHTRDEQPAGTTVVLATWPRLTALGLILAGYLTRDAWAEQGGEVVSLLLSSAGIVLLLTYSLSTFSLRRELRSAMAKGSIRVGGSTWDPRKPLIYRFGGEEREEGSVALTEER